MVLKPLLYANSSNRATAARLELERRYGNYEPHEANILIALGGDGLMLEALTAAMAYQLPVYSMNLGHVGARLNEYNSNRLEEKISNAVPINVHPLRTQGTYQKGQKLCYFDGIAWNEVGVMRLRSQAAHLLVQVGNKKEFLMIGDGHIIGTPMGSTSYNESAGGHLLGWRESLLSSTSICSISPAIRSYFKDNEKVHITPLNIAKRPVRVCADNATYDNVRECDIFKDFDHYVQVLYDPLKVKQLNRRATIIRCKRPLIHLLNKMQEKLRRI